MPDIDVDFCMDRRDEVLKYVTEKYGQDHVTQIITYGTMLAKGVIRDVGRVLDIPYAEVDKVAKLVPNTLNITLKEAMEQEPKLKELKKDPRMAELIEIALHLEGQVRHASKHAAGVVISQEPLTEYLPLFKTPKDEITTQFDMKGVEKIGLVKFDFLGLRTPHRHPQGRGNDQPAACRRRPWHMRSSSPSPASPWTTPRPIELLSPRRDRRHLPARIIGHARHRHQDEATVLRRPDRARGPLPPGPARERHGGRLHQTQERLHQDHLRTARSSNRS